jgi:inosose dehydratase
MKLAFSKPTNIEEEKILFKEFQNVGFEGLQLKSSQYIDYVNNPEAFKVECGKLSGSSAALITGGSLDNENKQFLRQLFKFAGAVGTEYVVFCHGIPRKDVSQSDIRKYSMELSELGKEARKYGTKLSLHHHFNQPVMYREDIEIFFEKVKDDSIGLTVDTAHLVKSGVTDVASVIYDFQSVIDNIHMKDLSNGEFKVLGEGDMDFTSIVNALKRIDYKNWVCADEESDEGILLSMNKSIEFLRRFNLN